MAPQLDDYLNRINYQGSTQPTLDTLRAVHRQHACTIAYENLDVILQRPVDQDLDRIFRKLVHQGRGGWCYEMNGLLGWALETLGFNVTRACGGVMRAFRGDAAFGNHLTLRVRLDEQDWIADVGLGDGILEPLALREGAHRQYGRDYRLEPLTNNQWRFHNRVNGMPPSYDWFEDSQTETRLATTCAELQADPESMFRQNLICQRMSEAGGLMLLGRIVRQFDPQAPRRLIGSADELFQVLEQDFGLNLGGLEQRFDELWEQVCARHTELFGDTPVNQISFGPPARD